MPGSPAQITHNFFQDVRPSWLPDGSGILYTYESSPVENRDRCLAILPPDGGTRRAVVQGNRLLAVVGGFVTFTIDPQAGVIQTDLGGPIYQVDLATGQQLQLPEGDLPRVFRHPVISPTGAVAAEGYDFVPSDGGGFVNSLANLLLYPAP